jgi:hypothetical protein
MGGASSRPAQETMLNKEYKDIVLLMMPVYFCSDALSAEHVAKARKEWVSIIHSTAQGYVTEKKAAADASADAAANDLVGEAKAFAYRSSVEMFYETFYSRLFDIHPLAKDLFVDSKSKGRFLVKMIRYYMCICVRVYVYMCICVYVPIKPSSSMSICVYTL